MTLHAEPTARTRKPGAKPASQRGFTLLEMVVVLLLLALVAGLAVPNLERLYAAAVRSTERAYILDQFASLGRRAMVRGQAFVVVGSDDAPPADSGRPSGPRFNSAGPNGAGAGRLRGSGLALAPAAGPDHAPQVIDLPEGWELSFDEPLVVRANGVCLGAELTLRHRGEVEVRVRLEPPFCRVDADA